MSYACRRRGNVAKEWEQERDGRTGKENQKNNLTADIKQRSVSSGMSGSTGHFTEMISLLSCAVKH